MFVIQFVILSLPEPLSERSEREAAEDGEGSRTALPPATSAARCVDWGMSAQIRFVVDLPHKNAQFRFCPRRCRWRSFAVLRRSSLATLAQRLRQSQDDRLHPSVCLLNM